MNEIEEKFYKCFDIKPKYYDACILEDKYWNEQLDNQYGTFDSYLSFECPHYGEGCYSTCEYAYDRVTYPEITDRILLELIAILSQRFKMSFAFERGYEDVKENILESCMNYVDENGGFVEDIQSLFTEV